MEPPSVYRISIRLLTWKLVKAEIQPIKISHHHTIYSNRNVLNSNTRGVYTDKSKRHKYPKRNKTTFDYTRFGIISSLYDINTKINNMANLFPRSITLIFRQSFDLSSLLTILTTDTCLVPEWNMTPTIRKHVKQKQKGIESHANH